MEWLFAQIQKANQNGNILIKRYESMIYQSKNHKLIEDPLETAKIRVCSSQSN